LKAPKSEKVRKKSKALIIHKEDPEKAEKSLQKIKNE
jgi:hypothetical protein